MHKKNGNGRSTASKAVFTCYLAENGEFSWRLTSKANGQVVATPGETFKTEATCRKSIANLKRDARGARIVSDPDMKSDIAAFKAKEKAAEIEAAKVGEPAPVEEKPKVFVP